MEAFFLAPLFPPANQIQPHRIRFAVAVRTERTNWELYFVARAEEKDVGPGMITHRTERKLRRESGAYVWMRSMKQKALRVHDTANAMQADTGDRNRFQGKP